MSNLNTVIISGNIANALELRYTPQGTAVLDFAVAVENGFGDKKEVLFIDCTAWSKTAESMAQHLGKGAKVNVNGRLSQDSWQDRDTGKKRVKTKIIANMVEFLGGKRPGDDGAAPQQYQKPQPARQAYQAPPQQAAPQAQSFGGDEDQDDIPF